MLDLSHGGNRRHRSLSSRDTAHIDFRRHLTVGVLLRTVSGDVTSLATLVACLSRRVQGTAIGSGTIARNMTELPAGVALHGLGLAIASEVVRAAALVTGCRTRAAGEPSATRKPSSKSTTTHRSTATHGANGVRTCASKVAGLATVVAASTGDITTEAQSRAVSLNVAEALAVIALLCLGSSRKRTAIRLVTRLLAIVAEALGG